jgi:hypothetical protein
MIFKYFILVILIPNFTPLCEEDKIIYLRRIKKELIITDYEIYMNTDNAKFLPVNKQHFTVKKDNTTDLLKITFFEEGSYDLVFVDQDKETRQIFLTLIPLRTLNTLENKTSGLLVSMTHFIFVIIIPVIVCLLFKLNKIMKDGIEVAPMTRENSSQVM